MVILAHETHWERPCLLALEVCCVKKPAWAVCVLLILCVCVCMCMRMCVCVCLCFDDLKQVSDTFVNVLNQGLIQFELKPEVRIIVYMTHQTLGEFGFKAKSNPFSDSLLSQQPDGLIQINS